MRTLLLIALLVLPALFSAAEVALLRLRPSQVQALSEEGRPGAQSWVPCPPAPPAPPPAPPPLALLYVTHITVRAGKG